MVSLKSLLHRSKREQRPGVLVHPTEIQHNLEHDASTPDTLPSSRPGHNHGMSSPHPSPTSKPAHGFPTNHTHIRSLNKGSEAHVDLWSHKPTGHLLAVKTIVKQAIKATADYPNEVHILKNLPLHKNIIQCEAYYPGASKNEKGCIVFEYLPLGDMFNVCQLQWDNGKNGIFSEQCLWAVYGQLASAMAFLHEGVGAPAAMRDFWRPVVHRDIKTENLFVRTLGGKDDLSGIEIKLGDFGLATFWNEEDGEGMGMPREIGTPEYWPPELTWSNRKYGPEADVWGIGAVIHDLAHGYSPIVDPDVTAADILRNHRDTLPKDWPGLSGTHQGWYWCIRTPRRPIPINRDERDQVKQDQRTRRKCPKYGEELNKCVMMALEMDRGKRAKAGVLKAEIEMAYAGVLYDELQLENEKVRKEEQGSESEESDDGYLSL